MTHIKKLNRPFKPSSNSGSSVRNPNSSVRGGSTVIPFVPGQTVKPGSINLGDKPGTGSAKNPENIWWPIQEGKNASSLIWQLLNNSNNGGSLSQGYADVLQQLVEQYQNNGAVNPDLVMNIFSNLLSYQTTQDQRQYDYGMLQEARQYNSPTNELARLMGAGISRDAALQILQGSGAGAGAAGSDAAQMMGMTGSAGSAAAYGTQNAMSAINTAINGVNCFAGLVNMGFNVAQSFQQSQLLKFQNVMNQNQLNSYNATGDAFALLQSLGAGEDDYKSVDSVGKFLTSQAQSGNVEAAQFIQSGKLASMRKNAAFSTGYIKSMFENEHNSDMYLTNMRKLVSETGLVEAQVVKIGSEIKNLDAQYSEIVSSTAFINEQTNTQKQMSLLVSKQADLAEKQGKLADAQRLRTQAETHSINNQNIVTDQLYNSSLEGFSGEMRSGLQMITDRGLFELRRDLYIAMATQDDQYLESLYTSMLNTNEKIAYVSALEKMVAGAGIGFAETYPEQFAFYNGLESAGIYKFLHSVAEGNYSVSNSNSYFGVSNSKSGVGNSTNTVLPTIIKQ